MDSETRPANPFPWREGNRFGLLRDGNQFYPAMLQAIAAAQHQVLLNIYLIESGEVAQRFIDSFIAAAERGVEVFLLLDDFGARGLDHHHREQLHHPHIHLAFYNPLRYGKLRRNLFRDHRKLLLVDQGPAFTGGAGISDNFYQSNGSKQSWHELMLSIEGPVVTDWQRSFILSWKNWCTTGAPQPKALPPVAPLSAGTSGRLSTNSPGGMAFKRSLIKQIRDAEQRIWLATAYFIPSWKIRRLLRQAAGRGVDVRLLLPGSHTDHPAVRHAGRRFYTRLLRSGIRIFEYQPRFLHAKAVLCDDWLAIGSSNIDRWNFYWNLEANQELEDPHTAQTLCQLLEQDMRESHEIDAAVWRQRPWHRRLLEWFWGRIDRWMAN